MTPDDVAKVFLEAYTEDFEDQEELVAEALRVSRNRNIERQIREEEMEAELIQSRAKTFSRTDPNPKAE